MLGGEGSKLNVGKIWILRTNQPRMTRLSRNIELTKQECEHEEYFNC